MADLRNGGEAVARYRNWMRCLSLINIHKDAWVASMYLQSSD